MLLLFTMEVTSVFSLLDCVQVTPHNYILRREPSLKCFDAQWMSKFWEFLPLFILYLLVFPWRLGVTLYRMGKDPSHMKESKNAHLITGFRLKYFWWDMVIVLKRLVFGMFSQFLFSSSDNVTKTVTVVFVLFIFFAADALAEPYLLGNIVKHSWNFSAILLLLCQTFVFDQGDDVGNTFLILCFLLLFFCFAASAYHIFLDLKSHKHKRVRFNYTVLERLPEDIKRDIFHIYSEQKLQDRGELVMYLNSFSRFDNTDISLIQSVWQARRFCDIYHDAGFYSSKLGVPVVKMDVTKLNSTLRITVSPKTFDASGSFSQSSFR
jgi:hypothetical protein